jgi:acyl carrier protein
MTRRWLTLAAAAVCLACTQVASAAERLPYPEIVDTIRSLAAEHLGRKKSDINTVDSLFAQGMSESTFGALVVAIQDEFGVVIPDDEIRQAKWSDPMVGLSVRRLAELVEKRMQSAPF